MEPSNEPPPTPEEEYALLAALHTDELALEKHREEYLTTLDQGSERVRRLRLLLVQQKLGRLQETGAASPSEMSALLNEQRTLLNDLRSTDGRAVLATRAQVLSASVNPEERRVLFAGILDSIPPPQDVGEAPTAAGTTTCPHGHLLVEFSTPAPNFSCDSCTTRYPQGAYMYGCRACNFDLCPSCYTGLGVVGPVRPNIDYIFVLAQAVLNMGSSSGDSLRVVSSNSIGYVLHIAASSIFLPSAITEREFVLANACLETFNVSKLSGHVAMRKLLQLANTTAGARYAFACTQDGGQAILQFLLDDLSHDSNEHRQAGINQSSIHDYQNLTGVLTIEQVRLLGSLKPNLKSESWYAANLLSRILPNMDESSGSDYLAFTPLEHRLEFLNAVNGILDELREIKRWISLEYLLSYYRVKFDRERRKPLLPFSATLQAGLNSEMNVPLMKQFLNVEFRSGDPDVGPPHFQSSGRVLHSIDNVRQDPLCVMLRDYLPLPSPHDDMDLIRAELFDIFAWKAATKAEFAPFLNHHFLDDVYRAATASDPFEATSEPAVKFCSFNSTVFNTVSPVELYCDFNGVKGSITVNVYHLDVKAIYRKTGREIDPGISLDGLMPHEEKTLVPKLSGIRGREVIRLFSSKPSSGSFVIEIVANGMAVRAVVHKGAIGCVQRTEVRGHVFFPFDLESSPRAPLGRNRPHRHIELWVDGKVYEPEHKDDNTLDGRIVVPFYDQDEGDKSTSAVLSCEDENGVRNYLFKFTRKAATLSLNASFFIDREALLSGNRQAKVIARPSLWLGEHRAPFGLLEDINITLTSTDADGASSKEVVAVDQSELQYGEIEKQFKVISNLVSLQASITAKVSRTKTLLACQDQLLVSNLNRQKATVSQIGVFVMPLNDGSYKALVLGRSGEPVANIPMIVSFMLEISGRPIVWRTRTDENGGVSLGSLDGVHRIQCQAGKDPEVSTVFVVPQDVYRIPRHDYGICALENDPVQFVYSLSSRQMSREKRGMFKLFEVTSVVGAVVRDCSSNLVVNSEHGPYIAVQGLRRGEYLFVASQLKDSQVIRISICGASSANDGELRLPDSSGRLYLTDRKKIVFPVVISDVSMNDDRVRITLAGGSTKGRRVHIVSRTFLRRASGNNPSLADSLQPIFRSSPNEPLHVRPKIVSLVPQRRIGDEILYCTARENLPKIAGTNLDAPSQLLYANDQGATTTEVHEAVKGAPIPPPQLRSAPVVMAMAMSPPAGGSNVFGSSASSYGSDLQSRSMFRRADERVTPVGMAKMRSSAAKNYESREHQTPLAQVINSAKNQVVDVDCALDFLPSPSFTLCNLRPDPSTGVIEVPVDTRMRWLEILATDDDGTTCSAIAVLPEPPVTIFPLDLTHKSKIPLDAHVVEAQRVHKVSTGVKFQVGSLATAKLGILDTFESFYSFARAKHQYLGHALDSFSFLLNWPKMDKNAKISAYNRNACHELNLFLKLRDTDFFDSVVRPQLLIRPRCSRVFLDSLLLDEDLSEYSSLEYASKLNIVERSLLAVFLADKNRTLAERLVRELEDQTAHYREELSSLRAQSFRIAILMGAAETDTAGEAKEQNKANMRKISHHDSRMEAFGANISMDMAPNENEEVLEDDADEDEEEPEEDRNVVLEMNKMSTRDRYKEKGPAHAWSERYFLDNTFGYELFLAPFWAAFARFHLDGRRDGSFLSADFCLPASMNITDALLQLAVIDASLETKQHNFDVKRGAGDMDVYPASTCLMYHEQVVPIVQNDSTRRGGSASILVGQTLLELDRVLEERTDEHVEREPVEIIKRKAYVARIVVTNVTSVRKHVKVLVQIPDGSIPLCAVSLSMDRESKTEDVWLEPFSTAQLFSAIFYFPNPGQFGWFPTHVCSSSFDNIELLAFADPRFLTVVDEATIVDETSWEHLCSTRAATIDQICAFLEKKPCLKDVELNRVCWRLAEGPSAKAEWLRVMAVLENRGVYCPEISSLAVIHEAETPRGLKQAGQALIAKRYQRPDECFGPSFRSGLISFDIRDNNPSDTITKLFQLESITIEVFPIVNARAHPLQSTIQRGLVSANARVRELYDMLIKELSYRGQPLSIDLKLRLVIILLETNRIATAKRTFRSIDMISAGVNMIYDYLHIYLAFLVENPAADVQAIARECLNRAKPYTSFLNSTWRDRFIRVVKLCRDLLGDDAGVDDSAGLGDVKESNQSELASRAPTFEANLDENGSSIIVRAANIDEGEEFRISFYKMNVEHLFSSKPFSIALGAKTEDIGNFAYVLPTVQIRSLMGPPSEALRVPLPKSMEPENVQIHVSYKAQRRVLNRFVSSIEVTMVQDFGVLRVTSKKASTPVVLAYCKVYARKKNDNSVVFFKDGYTDVRGEFDYSGLNTIEAKDVSGFAVFVSHPLYGCDIRKVPSPALL